MDLGDRLRRVDDEAALRLGAGDLEKALAELLVELRSLALEAGLATRPLARTREALGHGQIEDEGEVGREIAGDEPMEPPELVLRNAAGRALIGQRRIGEAVAQHPLPALERRPDGRGQVVAPGGDNQQGLAQRIPTLRIAFDQQLADLFGARRTAGLTRRDHRNAGAVQSLEEEAELGRFARALAAYSPGVFGSHVSIKPEPVAVRQTLGL